jgi:hypothetical protein
VADYKEKIEELTRLYGQEKESALQVLSCYESICCTLLSSLFAVIDKNTTL